MTPKIQPSTALLIEQEWILFFLQDNYSNFKFMYNEEDNKQNVVEETSRFQNKP